MTNNISVSILDAKDVPTFLKELKVINEKINKIKNNDGIFDTWIHFDVMDGKFVSNTGIDLKYIKTAKNMGFYVDTHLMVENPIGDKYIEYAIKFGTNNITIHYEIPNFESVLKRLNDIKGDLSKNHNRKITVGVSVKPDTDLSELKSYSELFDLLLLMSVEPGLGGQKYIESTNKKIEEAKEVFGNQIIQVDGGINFNTIQVPLECGVDSFVVGSYVSKNNLEDNLLKLNLLNVFNQLPEESNLEFDKKLLQIVPGGYGQDDILIGISAPVIRKMATNWYKYMSFGVITPFLNSKYHEYRKFACMVLSLKAKKIYAKKDIKELKSLINFINLNVSNINNWDLTDEIAPNTLGIYLLLLNEQEKDEVILEYIKRDDIWIKRIGIVSLLTLARNGELDFCLKVCDIELYNPNHLIQKAIGWVLREVYKKHPMELTKYLYDRNSENKLPTIILSYACEKMSKNEKEFVKGIK